MREQQLSGGSIDHGQGAIGFLPIDLTVSSVTRRKDRKRPGALGTAALAFITACGGNVGAAPTQIGGDSRTESPGIQLDALSEEQDLVEQEPTPELMSELFDAFYAEHFGLHEEEYMNVLSSPLEIAWASYLGIPKEKAEEIFLEYNTNEIFTDPTAATKEYFELIPNEGDVMPRKGDIIVIKPDDTYFPNGFFAIATGNEIGVRHEEIFVQYHGSLFNDEATSQLALLPLEITYGWMRPKEVFNADNTNSVTAGVGQGDQGEVLGVKTESMQEIFDAFVDEYFSKFVEKNDPNNLNQCMDLLYAWVDALNIPRETIAHLYAKDVFNLPTKITRDYFDIIDYKKGMKFQVGDIVVWDQNIGNIAGHVAISRGEEDLYFSQNYPIGSKSVLEYINSNGIIGALRPKGFGQNQETESQTAPDVKQRIDAILAIEPSDSIGIVGRKTFLSQWLNALNLRRDALDQNGNPTGKSLYISVTNLDSWLPNIRKLLNGERITNDPLKIEFITTDTMNGWDRLEGRGEMDDIYLEVDLWTKDKNDFTELEIKNGETPYTDVLGKLNFYERRQALYFRRAGFDNSFAKIAEKETISDELPPMSDWVEMEVAFLSRLRDGTWKDFPNEVNGTFGNWIAETEGWGDIRRVSDMYNTSYAQQFCYPEGEVEPGDKYYTGCVRINY